MLLPVLFAIVAAYTLLLMLWHLLRRHLLNKHLGLSDLANMENSRPRNTKIQGSAVVCGGSIAGLLTARICHGHFESVVVVEAEAWVASEEGRKVRGWERKLNRSRIVQYTSLHGCQSALFNGLKCLFPDFEKECAISDISVAPADSRFNFSGVLMHVPVSVFKFGLPKTIYVTRCGFETLLRRLVLNRDSYPNIEYISGTVIDIGVDSTDSSRLNKVVVRSESGLKEISAVLVADCTGPARAGLKWLERHGYGYSTRYPSGKLPLDQLKISFNQKLRYTSMLFKIPPGLHGCLPFPEEYKKIKPIYTFLEEDVDNGRGLFVLMRPDGDQILAFVGHHGGDIRPSPTSIGGVKEWIMNLRTVEDIPCWIFEILDMLEEIEDSAVVSVLKLAPTSYIRYHKATNLPSNFIAVGDSIMTVNPTFGEGCTKAFRGALCLHNVLRRVKTTRNTLPANFSTKFFLEQFDKIDWAWQNTRLMDYSIPTTEPLPGESLSSGSYLRWYIAQLQQLSITDDDAAWVLYNSSHGTASPIDALYPRLVLKIL
ncbi:hypothetical protein B0H14DRAFT_2522274 [Mycena olivaceomarginata]|nr:hypothetical protein B0H14DRAFT_2522274 [Mycena olivaceomarginata]